MPKVNLTRIYPGKLLLFGEYTALLGGMALAIPMSEYFAYWDFRDNDTKDFNQNFKILKFFEYAKQACSLTLHYERFRKETTGGIYFKSTIPIGYGLGSSGALTAAFYDRYVVKNVVSLIDLKIQLGCLESYFHGKSSGMDPLVSYINYPILNHGNGQLEILMNELDLESLNYSLIDSGYSRSTTPLVKEFLSSIKSNTNFKNRMHELSNLNKKAILSLIEKDLNKFSTIVNKISKFQFDHMKNMIHDSIYTEWSNSLTDPSTAIKLCGAGGGGSYLKFQF